MEVDLVGEAAVDIVFLGTSVCGKLIIANYDK